jgi:N-acetylmuramoyl-L-alanine amidase
MKLVRHPSPNHGARRGDATPEILVLHYTAMESFAAARDRLCDPQAQVSSHYLVAEDGSVLQLVEEGRRAWHAGAGSWGGVRDVNSRSIGIEIANNGEVPFAAAQMDVVERLAADILHRHKIRPECVIGHSDLAPARKRDPGRRFDWRRLALQGLAVWPSPPAVHPDTPVVPERFLADLRRFGYPQAPAEVLLEAFRQRFRPWATGPLSAADMSAAADLARRYPAPFQAEIDQRGESA